ncbi:MAG TPA: 23S rRNA (adenine(2503)-C(2))-methyltransferase RlmN [Chloroflexota bacterium]|jgi:23S rRNA (adenine2503-C2)-methyltransferase|nr:23S rRNA (adenine(2503)-C(2))-methyltransferase RlmN [Chloroflexota bacterium]
MQAQSLVEMDVGSRLPSILELLPENLKALMDELGQPAYRANQIFRALHKRGAHSWDELTDIPAGLRATLGERFVISPVIVEQELTSADCTRKQLLRLPGNQRVETVAIPATSTDSGSSRLSVCVSTQAGCAMACTFCATGSMGLARNLTAAEIVSQVYGFRIDGQQAPSHVVFMGMGEPLANYQATITAVRLLSHPEGANLSQRRLTISTSGLVPQIRKLAGEKLEVTLAISLHAPTDELRNQLMPINRRWPLTELMGSADEYVRRTHRRVSYEYVLLAGVNDAPEQAEGIVELLRGRLAHVNLIPYNATDAEFGRTPAHHARAFRDRIANAGISVTIRASRGTDITAACGQLIVKP